MKIEVHSKTNCPFCKKAKLYLSRHNIPFEEYVYDDDKERFSMYDRFGLVGDQRTVPQIVVLENDGTFSRIGGFVDLIGSDLITRYLNKENKT
jgi:glutaredoxin